MASPAAASRKLPLVAVIVAAAVAIALILGLAYLNRPVPKPAEPGVSPEAKAYLPNLALSGVTMKASENFMKQQVVEVEGSIRNNGPRPLQSVDVYCIFYGIDGREVHRERVPIVESTRTPLEPNETRHFRLPFDALPDEWNQALPKMVIAHIGFAR